MVPSRTGETRLELAPLGVVSARTHRSPIALVGRLEQIQVEDLQMVLNEKTNAQQLETDFKRTANTALMDFVLRQVAYGAIGGLLGPLLLSLRRGRYYLAGSLLGLLAPVALLGGAFLTFNGKAFQNPSYTGALRYASSTIRLGKDAFDKFSELGGQLRTIADNLHTLYGRIDAVAGTLMPGENADTFRVLHITDIHNNVAAFSFIKEVAKNFQVEFIVDTGDLTDFGSTFESSLVGTIADLPYPYVLVLGNHDSPLVAKALEKAPNVILMDGNLKTVKGVTLMGLPNPAASRQGLEGINVGPEEMLANQTELLQRVQALPEPPDIVAIHDPRQSFLVWGRVPVVLCGHMHRQYIEEHSAPPTEVTPPEQALPQKPLLSAPTNLQTILCNAGTTGAAGTRYFDKKEGVPFTCAVLTFQRASSKIQEAGETLPATSSNRPRLLAITMISLDGTFHQYSISRRTFPPKETPSLVAPSQP